MNQKEYNEGYQAAIEAIKKALQGGQSGGSGGQDQNLDSNMTPPPVGNGNGDSGEKQDKKGKNDSRTSPSDENNGVVREEDCEPLGNIGKYPSTPGAMIDSSTVNDIVKQEGHTPESKSQSAIENTWEKASLRAAKEMSDDSQKKGSGGTAGLRSTLQGLWKTTTDWKGHLKKIVGKCISKNETRQAFAAKKRLAVLGEIRRTEKPKYDCLDYMVVCIDSSGSMSRDQLKMCLSEVYEVARQKKPLKLVVIQCDCKIQWVKEYHDLNALKKDIINAEVIGRGWTDFKPLWDFLNNDPKYKKINPELVMIFTDGECAQYKRSLRTMDNLIWCILDNPGWELQYPDRATYKVFINTKDIK